MEREKHFSVRETPLVKINLNFGIVYVNDAMLDLMEMNLQDIIGEKPKIVCHKDMPGAVHDAIAEMIKDFKFGYAILKHGTKQGNYFWAFTKFEPKYKPDGTFETFLTKRKPVPMKKLKKNRQDWSDYLSLFYEKLRKIEEKSGSEISLRYLKGFLEEKGYESLSGFYLDFFNLSKKELDFIFNIDHKTPERKINKYYYAFR